MNKNLLLWGNNLFIKIDTTYSHVKTPVTKYIHASMSGTILSSNQYTYEEVLEYTNNEAIECDNFQNLILIYNIK